MQRNSLVSRQRSLSQHQLGETLSSFHVSSPSLFLRICLSSPSSSSLLSILLRGVIPTPSKLWMCNCHKVLQWFESPLVSMVSLPDFPKVVNPSGKQGVVKSEICFCEFRFMFSFSFFLLAFCQSFNYLNFPISSVADQDLNKEIFWI